MTKRSLACLWVGLASGILHSPLLAADWPQYRGPNHDGISTEVVRTNWTEQPPQLLWRVSLGAGLGSLSIADGRVFTMVKRSNGGEQREFGVALNADTGSELWAVDMDRAFYPNGGVGSDDGPRSTPSVDGDRVYFFTAYLRLYCLNVTNGAVVWSRDFNRDYGATPISWQNAASPLVVGDLVLVNCHAPSGGRLVAMNKMTGLNAWRRHTNHQMTQATPVFTTLRGTPQVVFFTQAGLVSVAPASGDVLWSYSNINYNTSSAASPVFGADLVYASAAYGVGAALVRISGDGATLTSQQVWRKPGALQNHWATPVYWNGHFYGIYNQGGGDLKCVNALTAAEEWSQPGYGYGSVLIVGDHLLAADDTGWLHLVPPDPSGYRSIDRFRALTTGKCWNAPSVSNGRIYFRSTLQAAAYDVSLPPPPPVKLAPVSGAGLPFRFRVESEDGSPLPPDRMDGVEVLASTNAATPASGWEPLMLTPVPSDGGFELVDPESESRPARFYQIRDP